MTMERIALIIRCSNSWSRSPLPVGADSDMQSLLPRFDSSASSTGSDVSVAITEREKYFDSLTPQNVGCDQREQHGNTSRHRSMPRQQNGHGNESTQMYHLEDLEFESRSGPRSKGEGWLGSEYTDRTEFNDAHS